MRSAVRFTGSPSSCCVFRSVFIVSSLTFTFHLYLSPYLQLQQLCIHLSFPCVSVKFVALQHIWAAFCSVGRGNLKLEDRQNRKEVNRTLSTMFQKASQEVEVDRKAVEEICSLTFQLFDRCVHQAGPPLSSSGPLLALFSLLAAVKVYFHKSSEE